MEGLLISERSELITDVQLPELHSNGNNLLSLCIMHFGCLSSTPNLLPLEVAYGGCCLGHVAKNHKFWCYFFIFYLVEVGELWAVIIQ
jgi:hypothetical protein